MDVRGKVIIQSIRAEPWSGTGGVGAVGPGRGARITAGRILLPTVMPTLAKTVKSSVIGVPRHQRHEEGGGGGGG